MNEVASKIQIGRRVRFWGGMGGGDSDGVIFAVHGVPNPKPAETILGGVGRVIRPNDCKIDVVLFNGRISRGINQCGLDAVGIGYRLLDRVHGPELIEAALRNAAKVEANKVIAAAKEADDFQRAEADRKVEDAPLFYWNGVKDAKGAKLQKARYSEIGPHGSVSGKYPAGSISVTARDYRHFSDKVSACFEIRNDSDIMTDYFDSDRFYVIPSHPLYAKVKEAMAAREAHYAKRRK